MIVVTGGSGFIGSAIVAALNARGENDILIVDHLGKSEKWKNLVGLDYVDYVEKEDFLQLAMEDQIDFAVDAIFHLGACSSTTETDCSYLLRNNYECSKILAGWAVENDARFIYASSAATYGDIESGFKDDQSRIQDLKPLNMYGYSKQMFDLWARRMGMLDKIAGLKYFNVYGPNEYHKGEMRSFVHKAYYQILNDGKVKLFKSDRDEYEHGGQARDFVYIKDAVDMTLFFYDNPDVSGLFNVGTGRARCWNDLAGAVFDAIGVERKIEYIEMPDHLKGKYQYFTQADISKIRQAGFDKELTAMEDAVADYVKEYLNKGEYLKG